MLASEMVAIRKRLGKSQRQMATLLATSLKGLQAYEQGWRRVPVHVERQLLFLVAAQRGQLHATPCWEAMGCPPAKRDACPAFEFDCGALCWFVSGTLCQDRITCWEEKLDYCRRCRFFCEQLGIEPAPGTTADLPPCFATDHSPGDDEGGLSSVS